MRHRLSNAVMILKRILYFSLMVSAILIRGDNTFCLAASSSSTSTLLRIRLPDGSMEKIQIANDKINDLTLEDILEPFDVPFDAVIKVGSSPRAIPIDSISESTPNRNEKLHDLGIKHGTMITVMSSSPSYNNGEGSMSKAFKSKFSKTQETDTWNPYPDLAKDYEHALLRTKMKRSTQKSMSYSDIAQLQSSLHAVEPQQEGQVKRIYICQLSAERFHANGIMKSKVDKNSQKDKKKKQTSKPEINCRVGLLLGTIQRERTDQRPKKARTSLSSQTTDSEYCTVAKVHALWEPPGQRTNSDNKLYDASLAQNMLKDNSRILQIASYLGLVPIGWIFSYKEGRLDDNKNDQGQAIYGMDVATGATLQIQNMKELGNLEGNKFVTLSMDGNTGVTEAFQLSDVCVQMVYENMFKSMVPAPTNADGSNNPQVVPMSHEILVDAQETSELDSVLCLINTAMLSHTGSFAGKTASSSVKKSNGSLTNTAKKILLSALEGDDRSLFEEICDFNVLVALDQNLSDAEMKRLCELVKKWTRGQKQGTAMDATLKLKLKAYLSS